MVNNVVQRFVMGMFLFVAVGSCGESPADSAVEEKTSELSILLGAVADYPVNFSPCCNVAWTVVPAGLAKFDAVNEALLCNENADYIHSPYLNPTGFPYWAGTALEMGLAGVPNGAIIDTVKLVVCARTTIPFAPGLLRPRLYYWDPAGSGHKIFVANGDDVLRLPATGFGANPFRTYTMDSRDPYGAGPYRPAKPPGGRMVLNLMGNNFAISHVYLFVTYN